MYRITAMTPSFAEEISHWSYEGEYAIYSFDASPETLDELLCGEYVACLDETERLVGYFCFGKSARIPTVEAEPYEEGWLDIGLGLHPELCGQGRGQDFLQAGMAYAAEHFSCPSLRLTVAAFNQRAIRLYHNCGFRFLRTVTHKHSKAPFHLMLIER